MIHDRAYTRAKSWSKALRKYNIDKDRAAGRWPLWYENLHQYDKGKIHCSCRMCATKTKNKHGRANAYEPSRNWSIADKRKIDSMNEQIEEENT